MKKNLFRIAVGAAAVSAFGALAIAATHGNGSAPTPGTASYDEAVIFTHLGGGLYPAVDSGPAFAINPFTGEEEDGPAGEGEEGTPTHPTYEPGTPGTFENTGGNAEHPTYNPGTPGTYEPAGGASEPEPTGNIPEVPQYDPPSKPVVVINPNIDPCKLIDCGGSQPVVNLPGGLSGCDLVDCDGEDEDVKDHSPIGTCEIVRCIEVPDGPGEGGDAPDGPIKIKEREPAKPKFPILKGILSR